MFIIIFTRQADLLYVQFAATKRTQRTLKHYGIKLWNSLYHVVHPDCAISTFKCNLKSFLLSWFIYIYIIVEKSPNSSHMYDHGFMDNTNRQAVCKSQKILWVIHKQQKNYIENHKNTPQSIKKTCYNIKCTYKYHFTSSKQSSAHVRVEHSLW